MSTWYKAGTANFTNGSATVTGSGTSWVDNVKIGDALRAPDGRTYEIVELVSSAEIEISPAYEGSSESNADYAVQPTRGILQRVFNQIQAWLDAVDDYLLPDNNLSELTDVSAARGNLGLGTAATENDDRYAHRANNLSDIVDAPTARGNLGLGTAAEADIVGTVSQSGGDPTGAVIERGSNSNGEYVRFADGTQICTFEGTRPSISDTAGSIFTAANTQWTFPAAFAEAPAGSASFLSSNAWGSLTTISTTQATVRGFSAISVGSTVTYRASAVGRWF